MRKESDREALQFINVNPEDFERNIASRVYKEIKNTLRSEQSRQKEEFLTPGEAAGLLRVNKSTIYRWSRGEKKILTPRKIGNKTLYKRSDIEAHVNREDSLSKIKSKG